MRTEKQRQKQLVRRASGIYGVNFSLFFRVLSDYVVRRCDCVHVCCIWLTSNCLLECLFPAVFVFLSYVPNELNGVMLSCIVSIRLLVCHEMSPGTNDLNLEAPNWYTHARRHSLYHLILYRPSLYRSSLYRPSLYRHSLYRPSLYRHKTTQDNTSQDRTGQDKTRRGKTRRGKTRQCC